MAPNSNGDGEAANEPGRGEGPRGRGRRDGEGPHRRDNHDGDSPHGRGNHDGNGRSGSGDCDGDRRRRRERKRDGCGRFADSITGEDVLGVFGAVDGPIVTSTDVGDVLGISTESARQHLNDLVSEGPLRRRKTGRTVVYWTTDNGGD
ncbi:hypothetical protein [Halalkalirubrum salinum]|uniref:hypothetical protein n=1 Tax=Halalkalirubrum salinum TaxID=2563889 RepID=UPI00197AE3C7|nr:hypothetical protein [Halalkalirubrum salinum]